MTTAAVPRVTLTLKMTETLFDGLQVCAVMSQTTVDDFLRFGAPSGRLRQGV
jgi:hypothetical protein